MSSPMSISRRGLFAALFAAPAAIAVGMPLADKLSWWSVLRSYAHGVANFSPLVTVTIEEDNGTLGKWETSGNVEAWQKWQAAHPFGRYKTAEGQMIGRAKHALLDRDLMREHGLPEYQDEGSGLPSYMHKALEDARMYVFPPERSYGERAAREYYGWPT